MKPGDLVYMHRDYLPSSRLEIIEIKQRPLVGYVYTVAAVVRHGLRICLEEIDGRCLVRDRGSSRPFEPTTVEWPVECFHVVKTPSLDALVKLANGPFPLDLIFDEEERVKNEKKQ